MRGSYPFTTQEEFLVICFVVETREEETEEMS